MQTELKVPQDVKVMPACNGVSIRGYVKLKKGGGLLSIGTTAGKSCFKFMMEVQMKALQQNFYYQVLLIFC